MKSVFFSYDVLMTVDDVMAINASSGMIGIRNMGLAKQPRRPSSPVLSYSIVVGQPKIERSGIKLRTN